MLFIRKLKPNLNKQSDSIRAKLFTQRFFIIQSCRNFFFILCVYCFYVNILEFQPVSHQHFYNRLYIFKRIQKFLLFNLKMTVERSKRRCFLTLTFLVISYCCFIKDGKEMCIYQELLCTCTATVPPIKPVVQPRSSWHCR